MDTLLMAVTGLSLAMALGMGALVAKLLREERRRSDARVAALVEMSASDGPAHAAPPVTRRALQVPRVPVREAPRAARETAARERAVRGTAAHDQDLELRPAARARATVAAPMFAEPARRSPWLTRAAVMAALVIVISGIGFAVARTPAPGGAPVDAVPGAAAAVPLELLSLRHTREADSLAVTGLVQNPRSGAALSRVEATASAFGPDGTLLAAGRAPLDFTTLEPGGDSPFVVRIAVTGPVARYRIGFRSADGQVIAHVDRRASTEALARK